MQFNIYFNKFDYELDIEHKAIYIYINNLFMKVVVLECL